MKKYKVYQVKTECYYQEIEAESLEEAIYKSDDSPEELIPIDDTMSWEVDEDITRLFNEIEVDEDV